MNIRQRILNGEFPTVTLAVLTATTMLDEAAIILDNETVNIAERTGLTNKEIDQLASDNMFIAEFAKHVHYLKAMTLTPEQRAEQAKTQKP